MWGCEADLTSMITKTLVHKSLNVPVMMTNLYPYLMGQAALSHERIPFFPQVARSGDVLRRRTRSALGNRAQPARGFGLTNASAGSPLAQLRMASWALTPLTPE